jgi:hypothetical protein
MFLPLHHPLFIPSGHYLRRYNDGCKKVHLYLFVLPPFPLNFMIIIEVDCFRRLEAGIVLPDDDLIAEGFTPAQIHAARLAQIAEARSAPVLVTSLPNEHLQSITPLEDDFCESDPDVFVRRLSTITERTEKTDFTEIPARTSPSVAFSSRRSIHALSSTTDSSYGEVVGKLYLNASACSVDSRRSHNICRASLWSNELTR